MKYCLITNLISAITFYFIAYTQFLIVVFIIIINFVGINIEFLDGGIMIITATSMNLVFGEKQAG